MKTYEQYMSENIDKMILKNLKEKLSFKSSGVDVLDESQVKQIFDTIEAKKRIIFLLFEGDFSLNEEFIAKNIPPELKKGTYNETIANRILLSRLEKIFEKILEQNPSDGRLISVCSDRHFFIQDVLSSNLDEDFIKSHLYSKDEENSRD